MMHVRQRTRERIPETIDELLDARPDVRLTVTDVGRILGWSRATAYRRADAGKIPGLRSHHWDGRRWTTAGDLVEALDDLQVS